MGLETATLISQLVISNPLAGDTTSQGDNHLRMIKDVLKTNFPGSGGTGFSKVILSTEDEINFLQGLTSPIIDNIFPTGTTMMFAQSAAPVGWTKSTTFNNYMLRIVSTTGGGSGGTHSPIRNDLVMQHTHSMNFLSSVPNIYELTMHDSFNLEGGGYRTTGDEGGFKNRATNSTPNSGATTVTHKHTINGNTDGVSIASGAWEPKYIDTIVCVKN